MSLSGPRSVGGRLTLLTVMNTPETDSALNASRALTVAEAVPASLYPGARWRLPSVPPIVVTLAYVGPASRWNVSGSPSGSPAFKG